MLELLFIALYQASSGQPAPPPAQPQAEQTSPAPAASAPTQTEERNRRRCRVENVTGSRLGARVCLPQAEREALTQEARDLLTDHMRIADDR
jgi:hypothetical protein